MRNRIFLAGMIAVLSACTSQPSAVKSGNPEKTATDDNKQDKIGNRQDSIEKAAEEATKIIEADAKADIDALGQKGSNSPGTPN